MTRAEYLRIGSVLGYGVQETMRMYPGLVFDMWELYVKANKREDD